MTLMQALERCLCFDREQGHSFLQQLRQIQQMMELSKHSNVQSQATGRKQGFNRLKLKQVHKP